METEAALLESLGRVKDRTKAENDVRTCLDVFCIGGAGSFNSLTAPSPNLSGMARPLEDFAASEEKCVSVKDLATFIFSF